MKKYIIILTIALSFISCSTTSKFSRDTNTSVNYRSTPVYRFQPSGQQIYNDYIYRARMNGYLPYNRGTIVVIGNETSCATNTKRTTGNRLNYKR